MARSITLSAASFIAGDLSDVLGTHLMCLGPGLMCRGPVCSCHGCGNNGSAPHRRAPRAALPVDAIVCRLDGAVHLQHGLVVHVGQPVPLQGLAGCGSPQEGFDPERDQLQRAAAERRERRGRRERGAGDRGQGCERRLDSARPALPRGSPRPASPPALT